MPLKKQTPRTIWLAIWIGFVPWIHFVPGIARAQAKPGKEGRIRSSAAPPAKAHPDLSGIWQAMNTANWNLLPHSAAQGPVELGAVGAVPPGTGVVEGGEIPYQPWAAAKQKENAAHWLTADPEVMCYLPGVPRATYMPYPFQIVQTPKYVLFAYEYASASRAVPIDVEKTESPVDSWMGESFGHWEGDTLEIDVSGFNDQTWFDRAGNFHSEALHVVERYKLVSQNIIQYEATIEDPKVFTRPWKISTPLFRHVEKNAQLMEFKCVEFAEEMMYGHLEKKTK
jgi:hypothetical protein